MLQTDATVTGAGDLQLVETISCAAQNKLIALFADDASDLFGLTYDGRSVACLTFVSDDRLVAGGDKTLKIWDVQEDVEPGESVKRVGARQGDQGAWNLDVRTGQIDRVDHRPVGRNRRQLCLGS